MIISKNFAQKVVARFSHGVTAVWYLLQITVAYLYATFRS